MVRSRAGLQTSSVERPRYLGSVGGLKVHQQDFLQLELVKTNPSPAASDRISDSECARQLLNEMTLDDPAKTTLRSDWE